MTPALAQQIHDLESKPNKTADDNLKISELKEQFYSQTGEYFPMKL